jgi:hypothetical protein
MMRSVRNIFASIGFVATTALVLLVFVTAATAQSLATQWQGAYAYADKRAPVPFTLQLQQNQNSISGRTTEPATFGNHSSPNLYANIVGNVSGSNISFTKTYDGTGGVSHSVAYSGTLSADGRSMSGTWRVGTAAGSFQATAVSPAAAASCITPAQTLRTTDGWTYWDFRNSCDSDRMVAVCVDRGNGVANGLAVTVPARQSAALNLGLASSGSAQLRGYREGPLGKGLGDPCQ